MKAFLDYLNTHTEKPFRVTKFDLRAYPDSFAIFVGAKKERHFCVLENNTYTYKNVGWRSGNKNVSGSILYYLDRMYIGAGFTAWRFI